MRRTKQIILGLGIFVGLIAVIMVIDLTASGERNHSDIESIDGIPFPVANGTVLVEEKLAHADVYLTETTFAKALKLTVTFDPGNLTSLAVGIRENSFWLSYPKVPLWNANMDGGMQTKTITIPITDALQDSDRSLDLMFFAQTAQSTPEVDEGVHDTVNWQLMGLTTTIDYATPTIAQTKNFIRSVLTRERPL